MSQTLDVTRYNVQRLMRDYPFGSSDPIVPQETMIATINSWYLQINSILSLPDTWSSAAISLVAGTRVYQLASTAYQTLAMLRRHTDGTILQKVSEDELQSYYQVPTPGAGSPRFYALYEGTDEKLNVDLYPTPDGTAVALNASLDAFLATTVSPLTDLTQSVVLSPPGVAALEMLVAAECLRGVDSATLAAKHVSPDLAGTLEKRGMVMLNMEKERQQQFRRTDEARRVRF